MVVSEGHCSRMIPGWLNGTHPSVGEGEVTRTICFTQVENNCSQNQEIRVKNCSGYFVYRLKPTPWDHTVYCTAADSTLSDPCQTHTVLDQPWRKTGCSKTKCTGGQWKFDSNLVDKWYRFSSSGAWKIPETVVRGHRCSGKKPGWLNGPHPNVGEGEVTKTVCFTKDKNTCHWKQEIRVKNCTRFFVYQLKPTPCCKYVYCTVIDSALSDPCETYIDLDQPWRSTNCSHTQCSGGQWMDDGNLEVGWYRFNSSGGRMIPETVVHGHRCSGENPGWLNGSHPSVGEQEVHRNVCFSSGENTCSWSLEIKVKNCTGYFVYWLKPTPANHTVYCTVPVDRRFPRRPFVVIAALGRNQAG
ncbi:uncharacterized protein [Hemitrygon akajei]|uniref:uncharacterized protein n=1 Tax=Hemitrygon akajei TaxID=2704970 RepID=UPI003BF96A70